MFWKKTGSWVEKYKICEYYTGDNTDNGCEANSDYIEENNIYKCKFKELCNNYTPEDSSKRCVYTTIGSTVRHNAMSYLRNYLI